MTKLIEAENDIFIGSVRELREGGEFRFRARGGSMWPVIPDGATLVVKKTSADSARPGDIIVSESHGIITVHRLIEKRNNGGAFSLRTQGDSMPWADDSFSGGDMLGIVTAVENKNAVTRLDSKAAGISAKLFLIVNYAKRAATRLARAAAMNIPKTPGGESSRSWRALYRWAAFLPYKILSR